MKVLFVAPWVPSILRPRSLSVLTALHEEYEVHVLALVRTAAERELAASLPAASVTLVPNSVRGSLVRTARGALTGRSLQTSYADVPLLRRTARRLVAELEPDLVHLNVFRTVHLLGEFGEVPTVIDLDEFRSEYYRQLGSSHRSWLWRGIGRYEGARMAAAERELVATGIPVAVSGSAGPWSAEPQVLHVPSVACREPDAPDTEARRDRSVLFVGRFTYEANVDAALWFAEACWPRIAAAVPDARLVLVGDGPPAEIRALSGPRVDVTGYVDSTRPYYGRAAVSVIPLRRASGVQMKLIEALQAGTPTVTSDLVAQLAGVEDDREVLVADDADSWVAAVVRVLSDPELAASLGAAGTTWAGDRHSAAELRRRLAALYARAMDCPVSAPGGSRSSRSHDLVRFLRAPRKRRALRPAAASRTAGSRRNH